MIKSVPLLETLSYADYLLCPNFCICKTAKGEELIFFAYYSKNSVFIEKHIFDSNTQCEALENHTHIFEGVGKKNKEYVTKIGKAIAKNLLKTLTEAFPNKEFVVFLEVNVKDSTIIRFHQKWDNEPPYFDVTQSYKDVEIFEFKN